MGRPKRKKVVEIRNDGFNKRDELNARDLESIRTETEEEAFSVLIPGWQGKIISYITLYLRPDNITADRTFLVLKGLIFDEEPIILGATRFFELSSPLQFVIRDLDCGKFSFANSLVSDYVDGENFDFWFRKDRNSDKLSLEEATTAGFQGFALRAFLSPTSITSCTWLRLTICLYPATRDTLLAENQMAASPLFPGISIFSKEIPLAPKASDLFPNKEAGLPVMPALISCSPFEEGFYPSTSSIIFYVASTLRAVSIPNCSLNVSNLLNNWQKLRLEGSSALRETAQEVCWPAAPPPPSAGPGWLFF